MLIPFLFGSIFKVYDDIQDNSIQVDPTYIEFLKVLVVCLCTVWLASDIGVSILFCLVTFVCYATGQVDSPFWSSCMIIPPITTFANLEKLQLIGIADSFQRILYSILFLTCTAVEGVVFPEEFSNMKYISRIIIVLCSFLMIYLTSNLSSSKFIHSMTYFAIGYFVTSLVSLSPKFMQSMASDKV